jgi:CheY-like chemotaxis protein
MPQMDGFDLATRIKQCAHIAQPTIMMLTSANQRGDAARCRELGVTAYLVKPIQQVELLEAIVAALRISAIRQRELVAAPAQPVLDNGRLLKILLAEDNVVNQKVAIRFLERLGHQVRVASNGKEALAALEQEALDLALMDVQMPEMDGFEATAAIRAKERARGGHLPIIAMTAHAMKGDCERCLAAGMDGYVSKPIQADELARVLKATMAPAPLPKPARAVPDSTELVFDPEAALEQLGGDEPFFAEVIGLLQQDLPRLMDEVRQAVAQGDASGTQRASHALKGSVGYVGARPTAEAARKLEMIGASGDLNGAADALGALDHEVERLTEALSTVALQPST